MADEPKPPLILIIGGDPDGDLTAAALEAVEEVSGEGYAQVTVKMTELDPSPCPYCAKVNDAATGQGVPKPGDVSICESCAGICTYDDELRLVKPTHSDRLRFQADPLVAKLLEFVNARIAEREAANDE